MTSPERGKIICRSFGVLYYFNKGDASFRSYSPATISAQTNNFSGGERLESAWGSKESKWGLEDGEAFLTTVSWES